MPSPFLDEKAERRCTTEDAALLAVWLRSMYISIAGILPCSRGYVLLTILSNKVGPVYKVPARKIAQGSSRNSGWQARRSVVYPSTGSYALGTICDGDLHGTNTLLSSPS